jgi:predicted nucleotidyltransferase/HEPN domain-containing protein
MKTELPERSLTIKPRLDRIVQEILAVAEKQIAMIILFGSYARGNWVKDSYMEDHILYSYQSDLDIMVVTGKPKYAGYQGNALEKKIGDRLNRAGLGGRPLLHPSVTLVIETMQRVNKELEKSQYFFSDIKKEGILLYDSGEFTLAEPRNLGWEERREIAQDDFDYWFGRGRGFLIGANNYLAIGEYALSAFSLHQATESFYNTILLVLSGYKGKEHGIEKLGSLASNYSDELLKIFPRDTKEQNDCFVLLQKAYIGARYDKKYKITEEELAYLTKRVEKLKSVTEKICKERINSNL